MHLRQPPRQPWTFRPLIHRQGRTSEAQTIGLKPARRPAEQHRLERTAETRTRARLLEKLQAGAISQRRSGARLVILKRRAMMLRPLLLLWIRRFRPSSPKTPARPAG